jgi:CRP-like cAMP-binding protein
MAGRLLFWPNPWHSTKRLGRREFAWSNRLPNFDKGQVVQRASAAKPARGGNERERHKLTGASRPLFPNFGSKGGFGLVVGDNMPFVRKLTHFVALSPEEITALNELQSDRLVVRRHREIITEGRTYDCLYILIEGYAIRCHVLRNGGRQVLNVVLPGDIIGFPVSFFERAQYTVTTLTDAILSPIPHANLLTLTKLDPDLAAKVFWSFAIEAAMYVDHLTNVGRRSAVERVAHFLLEMLVRLQVIGLADENSFQLPLTQEQISDAVGLSAPHLNRTLRELRADDLLDLQDRRVIIRDIEALRALAGFRGYHFERLHLPEPARTTDGETRSDLAGLFATAAIDQH